MTQASDKTSNTENTEYTQNTQNGIFSSTIPVCVMVGGNINYLSQYL